MKFDQKGRRIKEKIHYAEKLNSGDIVADLESRYAGIADSAIEVVFEMANKDEIEEIHAVLREIQPYSSKINTFI